MQSILSLLPKRRTDRYLLRESEDQRTRIFGTLLCEVGFPLLERQGYENLRFHLLNPDVSSKVWNMLIRARETAEEWAGYFYSEYEMFIQAQVNCLSQESLKGLWSRLTGGPIRTPHRLTLVLLVCSGNGAGFRYRQYHSEQYQGNYEPPTEEENAEHNSQLLQYLATRWHQTESFMLLQSYRSGLFTSSWIASHPEFKKLVAQGLASPTFINDYMTKGTSNSCLRPSKKKSH